MHEATLHRYNCWLTLTYDDEHLPRRYHTGATNPKTGKPIYAGSLHKPHIQKFFRKIRKALVGKKLSQSNTMLWEYNDWDTGTLRADRPQNARPRYVLTPRLRYYYGGEYGEQYGRPHYHLCVFGLDFNDKKHVQTTELDFKLYESKQLEQFWPYGQHMIGELNWETAAYTARYIMKKITGNKQQQHYEKINAETGEIINIQPEFNDMSRRPGIANQWWEKFKNDVYKTDRSQVRIRGQAAQPPRYYDKLLKRYFPDRHDQLKLQRKLENQLHRENHTPERLQKAEIIKKAQIKHLKQKL